MSYPTADTAVSRPDLGQVAYEAMSDAGTQGFIGLEVMPIFETVRNSASYQVMPIEQLLQLQKTARASRSRYNRGDWTWEEGYFTTKENGWEEPVDDREKSLNASKMDDEIISTQIAVGIILRAQEKRIADKVFNATNFTANAVTNEWDDGANATPITDVKTGKAALRAKGIVANALIISYSVFENLKGCAQIIDRIKYTFPMMEMEDMTIAQMAQILGVPRLLVAGALYNSANKGQTASISDIWSNEYAMLTRVSNSADIREPCIGRTFLWTRESPTNPVVESYRDEGVRGDIVRVRHDTDEAFIRSYDEDKAVKSDIAVNCSYLMSNITT